jgi:hypothetical protein
MHLNLCNEKIVYLDSKKNYSKIYKPSPDFFKRFVCICFITDLKRYFFLKIISLVVSLIQNVSARVAQWLEQRRNDLMIFASPVQIPLWDVGAGPSDDTV